MGRSTVLIVDDVAVNRLILDRMISDTYATMQAAGGIEALDILFNMKVIPDMVLLDMMMPDMDGFEVFDIMKSTPQTAKIPVMFITASDKAEVEEKCLSAGAVDFITKPFNQRVVKARIKNQIELKRYRNSLEEMVDQKVNELITSKEHILDSMANIIEYRNLESGHHVKRTSELTKILVGALLKNPKLAKELIHLDYNIIVKAVPLHDIGKIAIPDNILLKPGRLNDDEFKVIKTHTSVGSQMVRSLLASDNSLYMKHCYEIARHHHERWDGKGYPDGLCGEEIPLSARILSIVDVYDALVCKRVYKPPMPHFKAMQTIASGAGTQFDKDIVDGFIRVEDRFGEIYENEELN